VLRPVHIAVALLPLAAVATPSAAQVSTVDEGSFTISRNGARVGREEFRIRRTPTSDSTADYVASGTVGLGGRHVTPDLRTDTRGGLVAYRVEVKVGAETEERLKGAVDRGLFSAVLTTPRGEAAREYVVSDGALVLEDDIFHQYYFVARRARNAALAVVVPRRNLQITLRVAERGTESLTAGGRTVAASHLVLTEPGGATRDLWVDAAGRVLRVSVPARGLTAEREELPRE
jgi:hypothetical protein